MSTRPAPDKSWIEMEPAPITRSPHKRWFNIHFPGHRVCLRRWCWRGQTYQHRCEKHQELTS